MSDPILAVSAAVTVGDVLTVTGATLVTAILVNAIAPAIGMAGDSAAAQALQARFGALLHLAIGVAVVVAFALASAGDVVNAVLVGILAGAASVGGTQAVSSVKASLTGG